MTKFTKEHLEEIAELARKATYKPCAMHMTNLLAVCDSEVIEEMARQLLASMEQEPVAYMTYKGYLLHAADPKLAEYSEPMPLYAAPQLPQPAVLSVSEGVLKSLLPDVEKSEFWFEHNGKIFFEGVRFNNAVFEACRAAMLQAGKYPVTPDGWQLVPKEPTEAMNKAGWAAMNEHDAINPTYRAMLAAAPQQDVRLALEIGMSRYAGAMQKLVDSGD
ncbi:TPA: hypothetical protein ACQ45G_001013 [Citrobacter freundii]|uniref:hypothetical protein n=1 Tax=Citrobacter TaxID=544 RepID=UPI000F665D29|nr:MULTISPECIES: hypothetical protein [unclassified Citrobacter]MDW2646650.1 hypothetical protein [Citrobacter sp. HN-141]MDW2656194.1 hypothetical protein [Citrobacter sp. HN-120]MDW2699220.1 hypothetical protein [Citrobacter sp. HN-144]